jgi:hypothetical protein
LKGFLGLAVIVALGAVGWTLGEQFSVADPEMAQRLGAGTGVVFGLLIFFAMKTQS